MSKAGLIKRALSSPQTAMARKSTGKVKEVSTSGSAQSGRKQRRRPSRNGQRWDSVRNTTATLRTITAVAVADVLRRLTASVQQPNFRA